MKQQMETYGNYDPDRNKKQSDSIKKEKVINARFLCDLCSKAITSNAKYIKMLIQHYVKEQENYKDI